MRATGNPPLEPVPEFLEYEMWSGPAPLRPYDGLPHRRWWRAFTEYGNGIVGDMCVHMLDTARWKPILSRGIFQPRVAYWRIWRCKWAAVWFTIQSCDKSPGMRRPPSCCGVPIGSHGNTRNAEIPGMEIFHLAGDG